MMNVVYLVLVVIYLVGAQGAVADKGLGIDFSTLLDVGELNCWAGQGANFAVMRAWKSNGEVDPDLLENLIHVRDSQMSGASQLYFFPCVPCSSNASAQMQTLQTYIDASSAGRLFSTIWLDVEAYQFNANKTENQEYVVQMIKAGLSSFPQHTIGVYTSAKNWEDVVGSEWDVPSKTFNLPLWYAHYDNSPSFDDFQPFGGWQTPTQKQYGGDDTALCESDVDLDFTKL